jgi:hydroxymethylpyrimidine pyrophosphatase-like HAD family hydrolase
MTREAEVEGLMASSVGLPETAKLLAVPMDEIAVVDDSDNDIAMFGRTGLSISMGNASREVRMS